MLASVLISLNEQLEEDLLPLHVKSQEKLDLGHSNMDILPLTVHLY